MIQLGITIAMGTTFGAIEAIGKPVAPNASLSITVTASVERNIGPSISLCVLINIITVTQPIGDDDPLGAHDGVAPA